ELSVREDLYDNYPLGLKFCCCTHRMEGLARLAFISKNKDDCRQKEKTRTGWDRAYMGGGLAMPSTQRNFQELKGQCHFRQARFNQPASPERAKRETEKFEAFHDSSVKPFQMDSAFSFPSTPYQRTVVILIVTESRRTALACDWKNIPRTAPTRDEDRTDEERRGGGNRKGEKIGGAERLLRLRLGSWWQRVLKLP
ncbi:hypothetical protein P4O66_013060, partial [Electrophorus voltai]